MFSIARNINSEATNSCFSFSVNVRFSYVLSGSHALHLRFIRNKSVTRTVISVNLPFIIRYTSG